VKITHIKNLLRTTCKRAKAQRTIKNIRQKILQPTLIIMSMIKRPNPSLENLTQLVIENQKKIINKLFETIDIYKDILKRNGLYKVYNHLTIEEKQKIVNIIGNASGSKRALIRQFRIGRSSYYEWEKELKEHPDGSTLSGNRKRKFEKDEYKEAIFSIDELFVQRAAKTKAEYYELLNILKERIQNND